MTCPQLVDSGVYVLGALPPAQRVSFERHMATCAECQAEVNDLAVLPGLLGRLDEQAVVASSAPHPPAVVAGAVREVRKQRRGRRVLAVAAGFAIACLALVVGLAMPQLGGSTPRPVAASPVALHEMQPVNGTSRVTAQIGFTPINGGTQIEVKCQYAGIPNSTYPDQHKFDLFVFPRDGGPAEQVSSWATGPGTSVQIPAVTAWSVNDVARVELRNDEGKPLLVYNVT